MERSNLTSPTAAVAETPPPSYYDLPPVNSSSIQPPIDQLLPPSYNELGATGGNERYSAAFEGEELVLQDAAWYRAGLPRLAFYNTSITGIYIMIDVSCCYHNYF